MGRTIKLRNSKNNKFTRKNQEKGKETRKNILIDPSLYQVIQDVIIEEEMNMKGFVSDAIDKHIEEVADMGDRPISRKQMRRASPLQSSFPGN